MLLQHYRNPIEIIEIQNYELKQYIDYNITNITRELILQILQEKIMKSLLGNLQHCKHNTKVSKLN